MVHLVCLDNDGVLFATALAAAMATLKCFRLPQTLFDDHGLLRAMRKPGQKQAPLSVHTTASLPVHTNSVGDVVETVVNKFDGDISGVFAAAPINAQGLLKAVKLACHGSILDQRAGFPPTGGSS